MSDRRGLLTAAVDILCVILLVLLLVLGACVSACKEERPPSRYQASTGPKYSGVSQTLDADLDDLRARIERLELRCAPAEADAKPHP